MVAYNEASWTPPRRLGVVLLTPSLFGECVLNLQAVLLSDTSASTDLLKTEQHWCTALFTDNTTRSKMATASRDAWDAVRDNHDPRTLTHKGGKDEDDGGDGEAADATIVTAEVVHVTVAKVEYDVTRGKTIEMLLRLVAEEMKTAATLHLVQVCGAGAGAGGVVRVAKSNTVQHLLDRRGVRFEVMHADGEPPWEVTVELQT